MNKGGEILIANEALLFNCELTNLMVLLKVFYKGAFLHIPSFVRELGLTLPFSAGERPKNREEKLQHHHFRRCYREGTGWSAWS